MPVIEPLKAKVDELSINFDDYRPEARAKYEGTHVFVGIHLPIEYAQHLTCSSVLHVGVEVPA